MKIRSLGDRRHAGVGRSVVAFAIAVALLTAACSGAAAPGGGGAASPSNAAPAVSSGGGGATVPNPCTLVTSDDVTSVLGKAGYSGSYQQPRLDTHNPPVPACIYEESGPSGLVVELDVCTTTTCGGVIGNPGGDAVSGVGDDAFFMSTCQGPGLLNHDQLEANAKGLVFTLHVGCHQASTLPQDKSDQAMMDLMKLAISRA